MNSYEYVLFDLDGTLTDSKEGITKSVQYALESFGVAEPDPDKLERFIGPPLRVSFSEFYGFNEEQTAEAILKFRERYNVTGVFENQIYDGMADFLKECKEEGVKLAIASSKPQYLVEQVLWHFDIKQYFDVIVGCLDEGKRDTKTEVMEEALRQLFPKTVLKKGETDQRDMTAEDFPRKKVLMVGDRAFDIEGAGHFGVDSLGVTYGYAEDGELKRAHAVYLADSIAGMRRVILGRWQSRNAMEQASLYKAFEILKPLALYWIVTVLVTLFLGVVIGLFVSGGTASEHAIWLQEHSSQLAVWLNAVAIMSTYPMTVYFWKRSAVREISPVVRRRNTKRMKLSGVFIFLWAGIVAVELNIAMSCLSFLLEQESYAKVSSIQYSVSAVTGVLIFGLVTPIGEELIFRGVIYNRLKRYFSPGLAILLSALFFGIYHGNLVQFIYASLMGICMALLYEHYDRLLAPVLFHCGANITVYLVSKSGWLSDMAANAVVMAVCLLLAGIGVGVLLREKTG